MKVTLHYHNGNKEVLRGVTFIKKSTDGNCYYHRGEPIGKIKIGNYTYRVWNDLNFLDILFDSGNKRKIDLESLKHFKVEKEVLWK